MLTPELKFLITQLNVLLLELNIIFGVSILAFLFNLTVKLGK